MDTIKNKIFYTVVGFENKTKMATFYKDDYENKCEAQKIARDLIAGGYGLVVLRREEVWLRNEENEFSASIAIEKYTCQSCELIGEDSYVRQNYQGW